MLRVVLDTNIFVSSLLTRTGTSAQLLDAWRNRQYLLVTSTAIVREIQAVVNYAHIRDKYALTDDDVDQFVSLLEEHALMVPGQADVAGTIPEDPKDEIVLACALDGQADFIISRDRHLLDLENYQGIPMLTVRQFLEKLGE